MFTKRKPKREKPKRLHEDAESEKWYIKYTIDLNTGKVEVIKPKK